MADGQSPPPLFTFTSAPPTPAREGAGGPAQKRARGSGGDGEDGIIKAMAELLLINSAKIRTLENATYYTWLIEATNPLFVALVEKGKYYSNAVKQRNHTMGSPHVHFAGALLEYVRLHKDTPEADKALITKFGAACTSPEALALAMPVVRKSVTFAKKGRIVLGLDGPTKMLGLGEVLLRALAKEGAELKVGDAPRGPKEREIAVHYAIGQEGRAGD